MIVDWIVQVAVSFWGWVVDLLPDWTMPAELVNADDTVKGLFSSVNGLGVWVNWPVVTVLAAIPPAAWVLMISWKGGRMAFSHLPFVGGK